MKTVIVSIGLGDSTSKLIPYIKELIDIEDDEVLFAVAEELGSVCSLDVFSDKTVLLPLLESLAMHSETVVRDQAAKSLQKLCLLLSDAEIQNVFAPLVIKLAQC